VRVEHMALDGAGNDEITALARLIEESRRTVVLTGAGISTESGIPDFRSPGGIWSRMQPITYQEFVASEEARLEDWRRRFRMNVDFGHAEPNAGHYGLAHMAAEGRLEAVITQNIDGLHQRAGNSPEKVIEVHGTVHEYMCMNCGNRGPMQVVLDRVRAGEDDPPCTDCKGILKSATISFGQGLVPEVIERAMDAAGEADLFLAIGSTLQVYPVAGAVPCAKSAGARIVIVNAEPTGFDDIADAVIRERIGDVLPELCAQPTSH
jgi:NAD-dependent deacetylase